MKFLSQLFLIAFLGALAFSSRGFAQTEGRVRDIIKEYETGIADGMIVTIMQRVGDSLNAVDPKTKFKEGDKIRVDIESNFAGYVYMINIGSSGKTKIVFPDHAEDNRIIPGRRYTLPSSYDLKFDNHTGVDVFKVLMSLTPIPLLDTAARTRNGELSTRELAAVGTLITRGSGLKMGIVHSRFKFDAEKHGARNVDIREPIWGVKDEGKKKATVVTVKPRRKEKSKLQTGQVAIFGIQFENLGAQQ